MSKTIQVSGFPSTASTDDVKSFLEQYTGEGSVYALKLRPFKNGGRRLYAIVQFMKVSHADTILSKPAKSLWYGSSYLTVREMERDIVPKPRTYQHSMENTTLHFGCQISKDKFLGLWKGKNASASFGYRLRKIYFFLRVTNQEYKLELSYESIWQIELRRPRGARSKYLLIQVFLFLPSFVILTYFWIYDGRITFILN